MSELWSEEERRIREKIVDNELTTQWDILLKAAKQRAQARALREMLGECGEGLIIDSVLVKEGTRGLGYKESHAREAILQDLKNAGVDEQALGKFLKVEEDRVAAEAERELILQLNKGMENFKPLPRVIEGEIIPSQRIAGPRV